MTFPRYEWPRHAEFIDRASELDRLERWWHSTERMPISLYGRRRVGKSWLLRRFANGKPAIVLAAERLTEGAQLRRFSEQLASLGGVTPDLPDVASLFRVLYRLARDERALVVIDELPWLLGTTRAAVDRTLSGVQAVMEEERDSSRLKLVLCGSSTAQMEALQSERNPLHGRLVPFELRPLLFGRATLFMPGVEPPDTLARFAVAGGMPRYLSALATGSLREAVCDRVLDPDGPLWNEGRTITAQELREPAVHFAVLEALASGGKEIAEVANALRTTSHQVSKYLGQLRDLHLVRRELPLGASPTQRGGYWVLDDAFLRFWFRYVFPYQADLEAGLAGGDLYAAEIEPTLPDHVAPVFEDLCREHVRAAFGAKAIRVGRWWGNARNDLRRDGRRSSEEIDIVGLARNRVTVVGEARWRNARLDAGVLRDLEQYKIPALQQAGFTIARDVTTVLYSRSGFTDRLRERAEGDPRVVLVEAATMLAEHRAAALTG